MKKILYALLTAVLFMSSLPDLAAMVPDLKRPDSIPSFKKTDEKLQQLGKLLKENKLEEFYIALGEKYFELGKTLNITVTRDQMGENLWVMYYAAVAPPLEITIDESDHILLNPQQDIDIQQKILSNMSSLTTTFIDLVPDFSPVKKREIHELTALYYAKIMKTYRDSYDPDLNQKLDKALEEYEKMSYARARKEIQEGKRSVFAAIDSRERRYDNKMSSAKSKNMRFVSLLESNETEFVEMLVRFYPDKANEVLKYIKMAGYQDEELTGLIDRTVGRDGKTEFLYKGRIGRQHDRKRRNNK